MPKSHEKTVTLFLYVTVRSEWYECRFSENYTLSECLDLLMKELLKEELTPLPALFLDHETDQYVEPGIPLCMLGDIQGRYIIVC